MQCLIFGLAAACLMALTPVAAQASKSWWDESATLPDALHAGFVVVSTYHNSDGHLVFVLQRDTTLLLCQFQATQDNNCAQLDAE